MAKEENEKPRRSRSTKSKSEQKPEEKPFHAPAQQGAKHFSFGNARGNSNKSPDKPFRERTSTDRPRRHEGDSPFGQKPGKRFEGEKREGRDFGKNRSEKNPRFNSEDSSYKSKDRGDNDLVGSKPRIDSRVKSDKPFRRKSDESQPETRRYSSDRERLPSNNSTQRSGEKPTFQRKDSRNDKEHVEPKRKTIHSNNKVRSNRSEQTVETRPNRTKKNNHSRGEFKSEGEWLNPEDFKEELNKSKSRRKDQDGDELGYRPDYIPAPKREYRKPSKSKPTLESKDGKIRLNKYIANAGICSRREADELIQSGAIKVNGLIVTTLGFRVSPLDKIQYGNETLSREKKQYVLLNKPKDYITTANDPEGRKTVMELVKNACRERLYPVGRLDRATTGLLLLTNDGELAKRLMHPSHEMRKVYHVTLNKNLRAVDLKKISEGLDLEDGRAEVDEVAWSSADNKEEVGIVLHSGKNRIVRRIFEHLGYEVVKLDRTGLAGLTKKNLPRGKFRFLTDKELIMLRMG